MSQFRNTLYRYSHTYDNIATANPFYIQNLDQVEGTVRMRKGNACPDIKLQKSYDGQKWEMCDIYQDQKVPAGGRIYFRGNNTTFYAGDVLSQFHQFITSNFRHDIGGDLNSMYVLANDKVYANANFPALFRGDENLINAKDVIIPYTTLSAGAFCQTFMYCTNLVTPPSFVNVQNVDFASFAFTFQGCSSLTTYPLRTSIDFQNKTHCAMGAFDGCTALTGTIDLGFINATGTSSMESMFSKSGIERIIISNMSTGNGNFNSMLSGCKNLNYIELRFCGWDSNNSKNWVLNVAENGKFVNVNTNELEYGVDAIPEGWEVSGQPTPVLITPFCVKNEDTVPVEVKLKKSRTDAPTINLQYSNDNRKSWQDWSDVYTPLTIPVGSKVYFKGTNQTFGINGNSYNNFSFTSNVSISGDITTLLTPEGGLLDLTGRKYCFASLFSGCWTLIDAKNLILPSTIIDEGAYASMFLGCTSMVYPPAILPAKKLMSSAYFNTFCNCYELVIAPELMLEDFNDCFMGYFLENCKNIKTIKVHATKWGGSNSWVSGVPEGGTFIKPTELQTWDGTGYQPAGSIPLNSRNGIPSGWTIEEF